MADRQRALRLAERIKTIVASGIERDVKDPRLGFVTVTDCRVTGDLREATVFYTVYGTAEEAADAAEALESAKGLLRSKVGADTGVKFTPTLTFVPDAVPENARHIDSLLKEAAASDARVADLARDAKPAGEPDPYQSS